MNRTIRLLMLSDLFVFTGFGLVTPVLAIFVKDNITGGSITAAGIASFIYLFMKAVVQLPFSRYSDSHPKMQRQFLVWGSILMSASSILFIPATHISTLYFAQLLRGIGAGLAYPCWLSLWSTHLDKHHEGYEWSLYNTVASIGTAIAAAVGAGLVQLIGFSDTFIIVSITTLIGSFILLWLASGSRPGKLNSLPA